MNIYTQAKIAVLVFTVALSGRDAFSEPDITFPSARKHGEDISSVSLAGASRCQNCESVLGMATPESLLSKDSDFKQNGMFQVCQGCLDGKMDAQTQAAYVKVAMRYKWNSIAHNASMDIKFNKKGKKGETGSQGQQGAKRNMSPRREKDSRGLLLVSLTSPTVSKSGIRTGRCLTAAGTSSQP